MSVQFRRSSTAPLAPFYFEGMNEETFLTNTADTLTYLHRRILFFLVLDVRYLRRLLLNVLIRTDQWPVEKSPSNKKKKKEDEIELIESSRENAEAKPNLFSFQSNVTFDDARKDDGGAVLPLHAK